MISRRGTTLLTALALLVLAPGAEAATFQTGAMSYAISGSWTTTTTVTDRCDVPTGPGKVDYREFTYPVVEKGTFTSGKGIARYQGDVGGRVFFLGTGDRPARLTVRVTRTATRPVTCVGARREDCGARTIEGVVRNEFGSPFGRRTLDYHVSFGDSRTAFALTDPFKSCGDGNASLFLNSVSGVTAKPDYQGRALRYPTSSGFWSRKARTLRGSAKTKRASFSMTLKTARRTLSSKQVRRPSISRAGPYR